jgi:hypothetical protein
MSHGHKCCKNYAIEDSYTKTDVPEQKGENSSNRIKMLVWKTEKDIAAVESVTG